ncbi:unnamed protein product [Tuber melanosporum]|uniref:(Perigord truffle) hypothetical protein n=1 Tax=Tuber melanosporum (strain Mel28) TaxID=656061 RepID=D5G4D8_TUBMM|nr:uncharacterized protein GSTUM_00004064001 [Tuber melanosporum]CAZ79381.1 unnamed protein product [Tuber melanosporum]
MKPIGGIVTNKKSIPDNFRQVETFTTEYLSKLWKIYTVNRDVLDKGRRLENLFWRIWGSERIQRTFSGKTVSKIFLMILEGEGPFEKTRFRIPPLPIPTPPHPPHPESTPRPSLEIECPPTPPPSPMPPVTSIAGFQLGSSYLSKIPSEMAITASLHQAFPPRLLSPPPPSRTNPSMAEQSTDSAPPQNDPPGPSRLATPPNTKMIVGAAAAGSKPSSLVSSENESVSSKEGGCGKNPAVKERKARTERPPRGRRKVGVSTRVTATRRSRPAGPRRKSSSSSNTAVNTAFSSPLQTLAGDLARSLPSDSVRQQHKVSSTDGGDFESDAVGKRGDTADSNWIVDPDFRTKYLERKRKEKLVAWSSEAFVVPLVTKAVPTAAVVESQATASTKISRGKGKGVVLVDQIVPLKGLSEEATDLQATRVLVANVRDEGIDELPATLVRRKSELTLMFEAEAKRSGEKVGKGGPGKEEAITEGEMTK